MGLIDMSFTGARRTSFRFTEWIGSHEYQAIVEDYRREGKEPECLLDIITLWVMRTDALLYFPTYATFLLTVLEIVNQWQRDGYTVDGSILWPLPREFDEDGLTIKSLAGDYEPERLYGRDVTSHPIMREETFLIRREALRNGDDPSAVP